MAVSKKKQDEQRVEKEWEAIDQAVVKSGNFLGKYQNQLLIGIAVVVVIVCGYLGYDHFIKQPKTLEGQTALFRGEQYFEQGQDSLALYGDGKGYLGFEALAESYSSTKAGDLAKAYAGIANARLGKYDKAISYLNGYNSGDALFTYQAKVTLGDCYANKGELDKAVGLFMDAAKGADNELYSPLYYQKAAMIYREQKNHDKVIEICTLIKNNYMNSAQAGEADKYIEEAKLLKGGK
ncbi:tetratricopeptide (TPR) repeat protein [Dysgonomonas sp. PH5-45]|uniref:tetratricopeptide repeat protein n=1 Tax=unclassified Dysgonomonas TaxID=2630389 RepID=UPI002474FDAE|nr:MULTISPECIES: hypothetical protein [unclassified Dysgonomonas]MDH6356032.1 tetratricopeptide (TPR) repeat protein [Dysgonomonas sp. PH5-45]MDH6388927.1 tetratricopeptide (TPR) repeat protein [Dysgonomonas sp. PH5-37]